MSRPSLAVAGHSKRRPTLTVRELADLLGVASWTVYQHLHDVDFPFRHLQVGDRILFVTSQVEQVLGRIGDEPEVSGGGDKQVSPPDDDEAR